MDTSHKWVSVSHLPGYEWRLNPEGHRETRPIEPDYPPAGTWDAIDRHGEPRYVVEHDGKGGWWGVCQPDRPEDCYVLAASKELLAALKKIVSDTESWNLAVEAIVGRLPNTNIGLEQAKAAIAKAEGQ